jgi:putative acetyltransferase
MMDIRPYNPNDFEPVAQLFHETVHTINVYDYSKAQVAAWAPLDEAQTERLKADLTHNISYVAQKDNAIIGFGVLTKNGYIDMLYTHTDYQGRGIATAIYQKLEDEAHKLGIKTLHTQASITARPFFEKRGFQLVCENRKIVRGVEFLNFIMEKELSQQN